MSTVEPVEDDKRLYEAIGAAANACVDTIYGAIPLKLALRSADNDMVWAAGDVIWQLAKPIEELLANHPQFAAVPRLYLRGEIGAVIMHPGRTANALIQHTMEFGSAERAVQWLKALLAIEEGAGRVIEALWGVSVETAVQLTDRVNLVPVSQLPDSPQKRILLKQTQSLGDSIPWSMLSFTPPQSALVVGHTVKNVLCKTEELNSDLASGEKPPITKIDELMGDVTLVLALVGPQIPIAAASWFEFDNPDLQYIAAKTPGYRGRALEVLPSGPMDFPSLDPAEAKEMVSLFFNLSENDRNIIRFSLQRLNIAQRRSSRGDRAVDLVVAMESLIARKEEAAISEKIRTRAAYILCATDKEKLRIEDVLKHTYNYRSKMVHEGREPTKSRQVAGEETQPQDVIAAAIKICVDVIKCILHKGQIPTWKEVDAEIAKHAAKTSIPG
ncbi:TPA: hypothetical protein QDB05_003340 [Burkholderia vietnamiensis]|nr:hypothetical protein [Burkholderia vietnamiensis]